MIPYKVNKKKNRCYKLKRLNMIPGTSIGDRSNEIQGCSELFFQAWRHKTDFPKTEIQEMPVLNLHLKLHLSRS